MQLPRHVTCRCQFCDGHIQFDANQLTEENSVMPCPLCGLETKLFVPHEVVVPTGALPPPVASPAAENSENTLPASPPPQNQPDAIKGRAWFYSQNGKRIGPSNEGQIRTLIATNKIRRDSLVWCEGMSDWAPAHQTDIRQLFGSVSIPPPLTGESVNNGIVWTLAFAPIAEWR